MKGKVCFIEKHYVTTNLIPVIFNNNVFIWANLVDTTILLLFVIF